MALDPIPFNGMYVAGRSTALDPRTPRVAVGADLDFSAATSYLMDFGSIDQQAKVGIIRTIFIDNSSNPTEIEVSIGTTDQFFTVPANAQGYFNINAADQSRITLESLGGATDKVTVHFFNWEIAPNVWYRYGAINKDIPIKIQGAYPDGTAIPDEFSNGVLMAGKDPSGDWKTINTDIDGNIVVSNLDITIGAVYGPDAVGGAPTHPGVLTAVLDSSGDVVNLTLNAAGEIIVHDEDAQTELQAINTKLTATNTKLDTLIENTDKAVTGTITSVAASIAANGVQLLAVNAARQGATIYNDSTAIMYLALANVNVTNAVYTVQVAAGGYYEVPAKYTGMIKALWAAANGSARITELV